MIQVINPVTPKGQTPMNRIMLIEDDETMRLLLKTLLELESYEVIQPATTNEELLIRSVYEKKPDALLLDVHLKGINGINILTKLRSDPEMKSLVIIMTSGMDMTEECMRNHADGFLLKPYMPNELLKILRGKIN
jgi:DNA-binding response OmpR family regulator